MREMSGMFSYKAVACFLGEFIEPKQQRQVMATVCCTCLNAIELFYSGNHIVLCISLHLSYLTNALLCSLCCPCLLVQKSTALPTGPWERRTTRLSHPEATSLSRRWVQGDYPAPLILPPPFQGTFPLGPELGLPAWECPPSRHIGD